MSVDINQAVKPGHDVVINLEDGTQELGTAEERQVAVDKGEVVGEHTNAAVSDEEKPARNSSGKFVSKK